MGREWNNWPARGERADSSGGGCMSGMLHLLDFHHFLFATNSSRTVKTMTASPPLVITSPQLKGVEAPRNSLELDEIAACSGAIDDFYDIPLGVHFVPSTPSSVAHEEPRNSQSGTPRTPNLVARLMGLELLPDSPLSITPPSIKTKARCSKHSANNNKQKMSESRSESTTPPRRQPLHSRNCNIDSRSLPETPRASSVRSTDVVPRLSLQHNKENNLNHSRSVIHEFCYPYEVYSPDSPSPRLYKTKKKDTRQQVENRSSHTHYREIVKQVKESVTTRRVGGGGGDECGVNLRKTRKHERKAQEVKPTPSCSPPAIRFLDPVRSNREGSAVHPKKTAFQKSSCRSFPQGMKKRRSKMEKLAIAEKNQKISSTIHSWDVAVPIPRPVQQERNKITPQNSHSRRPPEERNCELRYVRSVLEHAGLMTREPYSINLPLKPTIFHHLELDIKVEHSRCHQWQSEASVRHRWNRRLLFHLVDEILGDISGDWSCAKGEELVMKVWTRITDYPAIDCRVVGDIDTLIERDLPEEKVRGLLRHPAVVAEAELVAAEIERDILDSLVGEAAEILAVVSCYSINGSDVTVTGISGRRNH